MASSVSAKAISTTRMMMAPAVPHRMPCRRRLAFQPAAGQRDDDGVVAPQQNVDQDDLKDRAPMQGLRSHSSMPASL